MLELTIPTKVCGSDPVSEMPQMCSASLKSQALSGFHGWVAFVVFHGLLERHITLPLTPQQVQLSWPPRVRVVPMRLHPTSHSKTHSGSGSQAHRGPGSFSTSRFRPTGSRRPDFLRHCVKMLNGIELEVFLGYFIGQLLMWIWYVGENARWYLSIWGTHTEPLAWMGSPGVCRVREDKPVMENLSKTCAKERFLHRILRRHSLVVQEKIQQSSLF